MAIEKILVANRGEIAVRVIRTCKEMGIGTVGVYSQADAGALHVRMADEAYCLGPSDPAESYLRGDRVMEVAKLASVDAVHPGYGFLAENAAFARSCAAAGLKFIGPPPEILEKMGDKTSARRLMMQAGVPVVPGSVDPVSCESEALDVAENVGYPVMIKGVFTGGGRSIRLAKRRDDLYSALEAARGEAKRITGKPDVYVEKFIPDPSHIEVQLVADMYGNVVHLGERDCSIQRRHQKLIEESPSPVVGDALRRRIGKTAVLGAMKVGYQSLGTMEFLLDGQGQYYFIECNNRIQVEHPVTEMVTGKDLIREQIRLSVGEEIGYRQEQVKMRGWAIECRINAEDPENNFFPSPGRITNIRTPQIPHVRIDTGAYIGCDVTPFYDSMISKVVSWGRNRIEAIVRMKMALGEYFVEGIKTTISYHLNHWKRWEGR